MEILNQFGINPLLLAAQVVNFLILLFILKKFLYGPILKVLETRKKTITESLQKAEEIEKSLLLTEEEKEKVLIKASSEAEKIVKEAEMERNQIIEKAQKSGEQILILAHKQAKEIVIREKEKLMSEVRGNFSEMIVLSLQKVLGRSLSVREKENMVKQAIE